MAKRSRRTRWGFSEPSEEDRKRLRATSPTLGAPDYGALTRASKPDTKIRRDELKSVVGNWPKGKGSAPEDSRKAEIVAAVASHGTAAPGRRGQYTGELIRPPKNPQKFGDAKGDLTSSQENVVRKSVREEMQARTEAARNGIAFTGGTAEEQTAKNEAYLAAVAKHQGKTIEEVKKERAEQMANTVTFRPGVTATDPRIRMAGNLREFGRNQGEIPYAADVVSSHVRGDDDEAGKKSREVVASGRGAEYAYRSYLKDNPDIAQLIKDRPELEQSFRQILAESSQDGNLKKGDVEAARRAVASAQGRSDDTRSAIEVERRLQESGMVDKHGIIQSAIVANSVDEAAKKREIREAYEDVPGQPSVYTESSYDDLDAVAKANDKQAEELRKSSEGIALAEEAAGLKPPTPRLEKPPAPDGTDEAASGAKNPDDDEDETHADEKGGETSAPPSAPRAPSAPSSNRLLFASRDDALSALAERADGMDYPEYAEAVAMATLPTSQDDLDADFDAAFSELVSDRLVGDFLTCADSLTADADERASAYASARASAVAQATGVSPDAFMSAGPDAALMLRKRFLDSI